MTTSTITPTYIVTFPRSGHHWLIRMLYRYYGDALHYCETYSQPHLRMAVHPETNVEKTHDFALDFVPPRNAQVIVQCRRSVADALRSWHRATAPACSLAEFAASKQSYWLGFLERWCTGAYPIIWYEDLLANPVKEVGRAICALSDAPLDPSRLLAAIHLELNWPRLGIGEREAHDPWPAI